MKKIPRLLLAAPKSGSGKTLITCAMLRAFADRGKKVHAFKCGPDYIDPMFHEKVLGIPSGNLDLFFTDEEMTRSLFEQENDCDLSILEGVMGLYDGLGGIMEEASSYHLARTLKAPVLLVVNARGMGRSLLAEIAGFLSMDQDKLIHGVILNQIGESFYKTIAPLLEKELGIEVLGYFPKNDALSFDSRYLGLKLPTEIDSLQAKIAEAAETLEKCVDLDRVFEMAAEAEGCSEEIDECEYNENPPEETPACACREKASEEVTECAYREYPFAEKPDPVCKNEKESDGLTIAVARDEAFCFYYRENFRMLEKGGAKLVFFSPVHDGGIPEDADGVIFGGGYPELFAKELSANAKMRISVKKAIQAGIPSLAECGGFIYLHDACLSQEGQRYELCGVIPGECHYAGRSMRFGYLELTDEEKRFRIRGHEYHYFESNNSGRDLTAVKPVSGKSWKCMHAGENHLWGFPHLYYPSDPGFPEWFLQCCRAYKEAKR